MFTLKDNSIHRGFWITLSNGYTVSVQFGRGTNAEQLSEDEFESAEIAIKDKDENFYVLDEDYGKIMGCQTPEDLIRILNEVSKL